MQSMNRREFVVAAASLAFAPRAFAESLGRGPIALVTADLESRVVAVDLSTAKVIRRVETLASPRGIETVGTKAVVTHWDVGAVSVVDGGTLSVKHVLHGFGAPRYIAGHPDGRHAYVTDANSGDVVVVDVLRGRVVGREHVGARARHIAIDRSGRTLWIALGARAEEVAVVDVSRRTAPRLVRRFRPPFLAHDVGLAPDGRHAWVSSGDRWELAVYDLRTGRLLAKPAGDQPPQHVTFAGGLAYVASGWSGTLRVHHVDGREIRTNAVPVGSYNVQYADGRVVTPSLGRGDLTVLDDAGRVLYVKAVARSSHDACVL